MTALFSIFKLLLKIAAAPVVAILALFVWFCTWLVCVSGVVLGLVSLILCVCAVYLILAFLASPFGLPTAALWMLGKIQGLRYLIQDTVFQ